MNRKLILGLVALVAVAGAYVGYRMYTAKTPTAAELDAAVRVDATALFTAFSQDEVAAGKLYNDKVVQVSGTVRELSGGSGGPVNVLLETGDAMAAVVCEFDSASAPKWTAGMPVKVKGFCAGFNLDVLLQRCAVVE